MTECLRTNKPYSCRDVLFKCVSKWYKLIKFIKFIQVLQPARVRSSNLGLGNQKDEKINCAPTSSYVGTGLTQLFSI
jgi:hypothetical protein